MIQTQICLDTSSLSSISIEKPYFLLYYYYMVALNDS